MRATAPKYTPNSRNYPAYNNHSSLPGMLYSLKSFKCTLTATNHQANDHLISTVSDAFLSLLTIIILLELCASANAKDKGVFPSQSPISKKRPKAFLSSNFSLEWYIHLNLIKK